MTRANKNQVADRDVKIIELYRKNMLLKDIAMLVGIPSQNIGRTLKRNGIERPTRPAKLIEPKKYPTHAEAIKRNLVTYDWLRDHIIYDQFSGIMICKKRWCDKVNVGDVLGTPMRGKHLVVTIHYAHYLLHRLAWLYMTGSWPVRGIDHKDMDPQNNKWENIRLASQSENMHNVGLRIDNKTGFKGVYKPTDREKWRARIRYKNKYIYLGTFVTKEEAASAYAEASKRLLGDFARLS